MFNIGPATSVIAWNVNSREQIIGVKEGPTGHVGFLYDGGTTIDIGMLPGSNFAEAYSINESGQIVGFSQNVLQSNTKRGFLWDNGSLIELNVDGGPQHIAEDISDQGHIVGWMGVSANPPFYCEAYVWKDGVTTPLGNPPGGSNSRGTGVNNNGQVCGFFALPLPDGEAYTRHAFYWSDGVMTDIGVLPGFIKGIAHDINDDGSVVGYCTEPFASRAFLWRDGVMYDLNDLIPPGSDVVLKEARAINNSGQIACLGTNPQGTYVTVLLTPVPPTPGDFNCDELVNVTDLMGVLTNWNSAGSNAADFNDDDIVDVLDLLIVIHNWTM